MFERSCRKVSCAISLAALATLADAQWSDGLEGYPDGSFLDGQGGWQGWDGDPTPFSVVTTNLAFDGTRSVVVQAGADTVRPFDGFEGGKWRLSCRIYVPPAFRGETLFVVLNDYQDGGPYENAVEVTIDGDTGMLDCPCGDPMTPVTVPLVLGQWIELALVVDLIGDSVELRYDGALLATWPWSSGNDGTEHFSELAIAGIDLYPNVNGTPHVGELYFDAFEITSIEVNVGTPYCFGDGSGTSCPCGNSGGAAEGCANSSGAGATLIGFGSNSTLTDDLTCEAGGLIPSQPALFFAGLNATNGGAGVVFGDGLRCAGGAVERLGVRVPDANGDASWGPGLAALGGWGPGDVRRFQVWYRDPQASPCGDGFNLSHGLEIGFVL